MDIDRYFLRLNSMLYREINFSLVDFEKSEINTSLYLILNFFKIMNNNISKEDLELIWDNIVYDVKVLDMSVTYTDYIKLVKDFIDNMILYCEEEELYEICYNYFFIKKKIVEYTKVYDF
jgi:hypothetical protein